MLLTEGVKVMRRQSKLPHQTSLKLNVCATDLKNKRASTNGNPKSHEPDLKICKEKKKSFYEKDFPGSNNRQVKNMQENLIPPITDSPSEVQHG